MSEYFDSSTIWDLDSQKIREISDKLRPLAEQFNREVYQTGMGDIVDRSPSRTLYGLFGNTELAVLTTGGRILLTLNNKKLDADISFIGDDSRRLIGGVQSFHGRMKDFDTMIAEVRRVFSASADKAKTLAPKKLYLNGVHPVGSDRTPKP